MYGLPVSSTKRFFTVLSESVNIVEYINEQLRPRQSLGLSESSLSVHALQIYFLPSLSIWDMLFCPCEELLSHMTTLALGIIHLKVGEKEPVHAGKWNLTLGVGISTRDLASLVPGWSFDPSGEIYLSCMDTHNSFLYSLGTDKIIMANKWAVTSRMTLSNKYLIKYKPL